MIENLQNHGWIRIQRAEKTFSKILHKYIYYIFFRKNISKPSEPFNSVGDFCIIKLDLQEENRRAEKKN